MFKIKRGNENWMRGLCIALGIGFMFFGAKICCPTKAHALLAILIIGAGGYFIGMGVAYGQRLVRSTRQPGRKAKVTAYDDGGPAMPGAFDKAQSLWNATIFRPPLPSDFMGPSSGSALAADETDK
jgi:hypothetical protein